MQKMMNKNKSTAPAKTLILRSAAATCALSALMLTGCSNGQSATPTQVAAPSASALAARKPVQLPSYYSPGQQALVQNEVANDAARAAASGHQ